MTSQRQTNLRLAVWLLALASMFVLGGQLADTMQAMAQEAAPQGQAAEDAEAAPADDADDGSSDESLADIIIESGPSGWVFYFVLFLFSMVATTVALERVVNLRREKVLPRVFVQRLQELIRSGQDTADNLKVLAESYRAPAAAILKGGVVRAGRPLPEVEKGMEDSAAREMSALRGRNKILSVVGSVAPLVGLLGTVVGMIMAFRTTSSHDGLGAAAGASLAKGIYIALITTAAGLTIAIPCMLCFAWFNSRVERFFRETDEVLLESMPSFSRIEAEQNAAGAAEVVHAAVVPATEAAAASV
jgi:biopolymer transport protein ExbB